MGPRMLAEAIAPTNTTATTIRATDKGLMKLLRLPPVLAI
jgi:hypothetical protein